MIAAGSPPEADLSPYGRVHALAVVIIHGAGRFLKTLLNIDRQ